MRHLLLLLIVLQVGALVAQPDSTLQYLQEVEARVDTQKFTWSGEKLYYQDRWRLPFQYSSSDPVVEFTLHFRPDSLANIQEVRVGSASDYGIMDSLYVSKEGKMQFRLRYRDVSNTDFLKLPLIILKGNGDTAREELALLAYAETMVELYVRDEQLYMGEEKVLELVTNRPENIALQHQWEEKGNLRYRMTLDGNRVLLHLLPSKPGTHSFSFHPRLKKPVVRDGKPQYQLPEVGAEFQVKTGRLAFLSLSEEEVTLREGSTDPIEVQINDNRQLEMNKTYRIENQEQPGGALIAELFTKSKLNNGKVLCFLRPYGLHRQSEGYLYIKDGDKPQFITNFNILPRTSIDRVYVQREGEDWKESRQVYPGETLHIRLEGKAMDRGHFNFYGARILDEDTLVRNENTAYFKCRIPLDISQREIEIFNNNRSLGTRLKINEYKRPRPFDYINLELGKEHYKLSEVHQPIFYENTLPDIVFNFDSEKIDEEGQLHGKQHLTIKVRVSNKEGNLIELYEFDDIVACPGKSSPRHQYYNKNDCRLEDINLNEFLTRKTHSLPEWASVELEVSHQRDRYDGEGITKRIKVILQRRFNFDIDVSFPAGLLILKRNENDFTNFGGISFAMIGQWSFYNTDKIATYYPFKIGAGFVALDAFNFSEEASNRDVGLVFMGSVYPTSSENKLSFPLFIGYGYLLRQQKSFFLVGPGIRVRF